MKKLLFVLTLLLSFPLVVYAHSGGTDANGGHYNRSTGEYHYHHGYSAHLHPGGVCPYDYNDRTGYSSSPSVGSSSGSSGKSYSSGSSKSRSTAKALPPASSSKSGQTFSKTELYLFAFSCLSFIFVVSYALNRNKTKPAPAVKPPPAPSMPVTAPSVVAAAPPPVPKRPHRLILSDVVMFDFEGRSVPLYKLPAIFLFRVGYCRDTETLFVTFFDDPSVYVYFGVPLSLCSELVRSERPDLYFFGHIESNFKCTNVPFS